MPKTDYTECPICRRPPASRSRFCDRHKARLARFGDPEGKAIPMKGKRNAFDLQMKIARRYLQLHADNPATAAAVELARQLLDYKASTAITADLKLQQAFSFQREAGADAGEVVARVVAFYLYAARHPFKSTRAEDCALGRLVCHVVPMGGFRWSASVYCPAGELARRYLGTYAVRLLQRIERDASNVSSLVRQSGTF